MRHFATEEWIDFVNQVATTEKHAAMKAHLKGGCEKCSRELAVWSRVRDIAANENTLEPPGEVLATVKMSYTHAQPRRQKSLGTVIEVLFDSFLQPALAGARSSVAGSRQMLYRAGPSQIDVQVEVKPGSNLVMVAGQVMNASTLDFVARGIPVTLSNLHGHVIYTATNEFGEFSGEIKNSGDLELSIPRRGETPVTISLRNALGQVPGEKA